MFARPSGTAPSPASRSPGRRVAAFVFVAAFLAQGILAIFSNAGTCDELGAHLPSGVLAWKSGTFSGGIANPPLGQLLVAALPTWTGSARHPLSESPFDLAAARAPSLALGILLLLVTASFARRVAGDIAGLATLAIAACCPNVIAHAGLATLDLPAAAFGALACLLAWDYARAPSRTRFATLALALGAAAETKFTALHLVPALAAGAAFFAGDRSVAARLRLALSIALAGALGVVCIDLLLSLAFPPVGGTRFAWQNLLTKWAHGREGHMSFLLGARSAHGFPHYFLVALVVKVPLATLLFAAVGAARLSRDTTAENRRGFVAFVLVPALWVFCAMSFVHRVHIGVRHILPVFPALLALAGLGAQAFLMAGGRRRAVALLFFAWLAFSAAIAMPRPLAYFNEIAGGTRGGERFLLDSNLDWGQDERTFRRAIQGQSINVNPSGPAKGIVAANANARYGVLSRSDRRLGWMRLLPAERRIGDAWILVNATETAIRAAGARGPREALDAARWLAGCGDPREAVRLLESSNLSSHPKLAASWHDAMAEALLAAGDPIAAERHLVPGIDVDLACEVAFAVEDARGTPWSARDARLRGAILPALIAREKASRAESLAVRVFAEDPGDRDARRGLLLARLAQREGDRRSGPDDDPTRALFAAHEVPNAAPDLYFTRTTPELRFEERLIRVHLLRDAGCERRALVEAGALLGDDPANTDALDLYGELVVRRKLGLSEYPMPNVSWEN